MNNTVITTKTVALDDLIPLIKEKLNSQGAVTFTPMGNSMFPTLCSGRDTVMLVKAKFPLKKYSMVLYQRRTGSYVLHRVVGIKDGVYTMRGDNQLVKEHGIEEDQIIGVVKEYNHRKKCIKTSRIIVQLYGVYIVRTAHLRRVYYKLRHFLGRIKNG